MLTGVLDAKSGERLELEDEAVFPMLKASDLGNGKPVVPTRWMVVPQRSTGEDTQNHLVDSLSTSLRSMYLISVHIIIMKMME